MSKRSYLIGLIGQGIQASRTPFMHEQEGRRQGLAYVYRLIDLDRLALSAADLPELMAWAKRMGFDGLNITHPCKQAVIPLLDELSEDARAVGAVNTVAIREGRTVGHNTDCSGYMEGFKAALPDVAMDTVLQVGAGGAGSAVAHALMKLGTGRLLLSDTHPHRAEALAADINRRFGEGRAVFAPHVVSAGREADGVVNCTPVGMANHPGLPFPATVLRSEMWVSEIIYFPLETELTAAARALGCRVADGSGMGVYQAVGAFEHFTGLKADPEAMKASFVEAGKR